VVHDLRARARQQHRPGANGATAGRGTRCKPAVPLAGDRLCGDYRGAVKADFSDDPNAHPFCRQLPDLAAARRVWPVAYADPASFATACAPCRGCGASMGGKLSGTRARGSAAPTGPASKSTLAAGPALEIRSAPLAEIIRDINKYSNNVMAQQVFLTLGRVPQAQGANGSQVSTPWQPPQHAASNCLTRRGAATGGMTAFQTDDAAGTGQRQRDLSRQERISAQALGHLLQSGLCRSPLMPELMASLAHHRGGRHAQKPRAIQGRWAAAHLKTGSLCDDGHGRGRLCAQTPAASACCVGGDHANHPNAKALPEPAIAALVEWAAKEN
jgi:D-alanyl-D-alanine carboxypeptidase/D-alanyl-D-alanine-endopeptidase (penicillin-binding protein 4)